MGTPSDAGCSIKLQPAMTADILRGCGTPSGIASLPEQSRVRPVPLERPDHGPTDCKHLGAALIATLSNNATDGRIPLNHRTPAPQRESQSIKLYYRLSIPPFTSKVMPVTQPASSEARYNTA